ncbi:uncharacterized protein [Arachis hypogaea]|uniref:uncharacterized protein n=1 Tax=Arachis hypogaea TaxID=3818 RepID=UPI003B227CA4
MRGSGGCGGYGLGDCGWLRWLWVARVLPLLSISSFLQFERGDAEREPWLQLFPNPAVPRLSKTGSDHAPLLFDTNPQTEHSKRRFKFQTRWCEEDSVQIFISEVWNTEIEGSPIFRLAQKFKLIRHRLVIWQRSSLSNSKKQIDEITKQLEEMRASGLMGGLEIMELEQKLDRAYLNEELYWKDKSRIKWLKEGDKNTSFFHEKFKARSKKNKIWRLKAENGEWTTSNATIAGVAEEYFKGIFTSTN